MLHRDIKPANLLLDTRANVWVTDFGLAKSEDQHNLTNPGDVVGTLRYMAPERFEGHSDARCDLYALGATLYELLTLRPPFEGKSRERLIERVLHQEPIPPRRRDARIPRGAWRVICLKCLEKEPGHRYGTAAELAEELQRFLAGEPIRARRVSAMEWGWRWCKRNPVVALAVLAASGASSYWPPWPGSPRSATCVRPPCVRKPTASGKKLTGSVRLPMRRKPRPGVRPVGPARRSCRCVGSGMPPAVT